MEAVKCQECDYTFYYPLEFDGKHTKKAFILWHGKALCADCIDKRFKRIATLEAELEALKERFDEQALCAEEFATTSAENAKLKAELAHEKKFHCYWKEGDSVTQGSVNACQSAYDRSLGTIDNLNAELAKSKKV